jgi:hypothetical protein
MKLNRRTLLRGMLGGAVIGVGLPPLEIFMNVHGTSYAGETADGFPRRFCLFSWGNGMLPDRWVPASEGEGDAWELSDQLMPLAAFKSDLAVITGMRVGVPNIEPHHATAAGMLTGMRILKEGDDWTFAGPTIDQVIASEIGKESLYKSIEFGAKPGDGLSFNGPHSRNPPEQSPLALFDRLFGSGFSLPGEEGVVDPTLALRRSILDVVMEDMKAVQTAVGAADKARLEQHLDGIRDLEKRLAKLQEDPPNLAACEYPPTPEDEYPNIEGRPQFQEKNKAFADISAMALACDQTRVFSNMFTKPLTNSLFQEVSAGHHQLTHDEPGEQPQVHQITIQCMEAFAAQLESLAAIEEGDGRLLDHCLVFATSDVSQAKLHSGDDFPILIAGGAGGTLKRDIHYRSPSGENASKVLLTMCRAMGVDLPEFGSDEGHVTEGLPEIEV